VISAVVFDMDGVLIDARDWHYIALNLALAPFGFEIDQPLHIGKLNGLPTREKLKFLSEKRGLPKGLHGIVSSIKQEETKRLASQLCRPNFEHLLMLNEIKKIGLNIGLATNSIRETTIHMLGLADVLKYLDCILTNEDVAKAKPDPEIYKLISAKLDLPPSQILVVEDHAYGVEAAISAGCNVIKVNSPSDLNWNLLKSEIQKHA
jgi:beta-phosphoglucomutase